MLLDHPLGCFARVRTTGGRVTRPGLTIVSHQRWRADDLASYADVRLDHGLDLDAAADPQAVLWCPGAWAAAAVTRHRHLRLSSAGPRWLDGLPTWLTGRVIRTLPASEMLTAAWRSMPSRTFAKLPESKHELFEARVRDVGELGRDLHRLPVDEPIQVQTPITFFYEVRCWVLGGEVVAHSVYMPGVDRGRWSEVSSPPRDLEGCAWLAAVVREKRIRIPQAVVIDVGWCDDPVSGREGWRIVEANAPWSADWYLAEDLDAVVETIRESQRRVRARWEWRPSPILIHQSRALLAR